MGSQLGELPTKAKTSTSTSLRFIPALTSGDRHSARRLGLPKSYRHTQKLVWERARSVIKVSLGRIMANLTRSDKNSKCAYHFHMVKKEEVETQRPHSALVMVWYKSDMTGKSHSVDKTKKWNNRMQLQLSEWVIWVPVLKSWILTPFCDISVHASICGQTDILSPQQLVNICTAGGILWKHLGKRQSWEFSAPSWILWKRSSGLESNKRA